MVTELGKILRIIRINIGDSMRNMADKLNLSAAYLSAIENGKRNVPNNFEEKVISSYPLSDKDREKLRAAITETASKVKVNITELSDKRKRLLFALTKGDLDDETIDEIWDVIERRGALKNE